MSRLLAIACALLSVSVSAEETKFGYIAVDRLEHYFNSDMTLLDIEASYGSDDYQWLGKLTSEDLAGKDLHQLQFLYARPVSAFFNLQLGILAFNADNQWLSGAIVGLEGLAPNRVATELQLIITEKGDAIVTTEFKRDFLLTNKFIVEPKIEFAAESGSGNLAAEMRVRYEVTRKFAPYVGFAWHKAFGEAADILTFIGEDTSSTSAIAGVRFWF